MENSQEDRPKKGLKTPKASGSAGRGKSEKARRSKSVRAGLTFPVARVGRFLKLGRYAKRVGTGASVYLGIF